MIEELFVMGGVSGISHYECMMTKRQVWNKLAKARFQHC